MASLLPRRRRPRLGGHPGQRGAYGVDIEEEVAAEPKTRDRALAGQALQPVGGEPEFLSQLVNPNNARVL